MKVNLIELGPKLTALDSEIAALLGGLADEIPVSAPDGEDWPAVRAGLIAAGKQISEAGKAAIRRTFAPEL